MWEQSISVLHGRISLQRFSVLVIAFFMTLFSIVSLLTSTAYADGGATRSGDALVYQGNKYDKAAAADLPGDVVSKAPNTTGYRYVDNAGKAYFILTTGDPTKATTGYYETYDYTPPNTYSNPTSSIQITIGADNTQGTTDTQKESSGCDGATIGGIGWFVCPTVNFIAKGMDKIYSIISGFLEVKTVTNDTQSSIYQLWATVRDIANVAFVIVFMVIVYSQITNIGLSNYSVKNMLPRLIIAAILVNASFWVCAAAVDASNFLGYSIHNMFTALMDKFSVGSNYSGGIPTWQQVAAVALSGGAVIGGALFVAANTVSGTVFLLIPFLLGAVLSALVALIVLAARQALITILIIVAPLAFVAYTMPNTEKYFNKWRETLMTMLMLFPIFSVIFSGAQLAGMAIIQSANGNLFTIILGLAVQVAPIVITPMLIKFSGNLIGKIAGMVNNPNRGLLDRTRNWSKGMAQERKNKVLAGQNRYFNRNPINNATKALDTRRRRIDGKRKAYESMADNRFAATRQGQTIEAMNRSAANEKQRVDNVFANSTRGRQLELQSRNLGVEKQEIENSLLRSSGGHQLTRRQQMAEIDKSRVHNEFEDSHAGHDVDRAKRVVEAEKKRIENTHQANWDNAVRTDANLNRLELSVKASEISAASAKAKLDKMHAEVITKGADAQFMQEHVQNLRNSNAEISSGILQVAQNINQAQVEATLAGMAKNAAEHKLSAQVNQALLDNVTDVEGVRIRQYAAGIGNQDAVLANSVAQHRKEFAEEVAHQKELSSHFKISANQIAALAKGRQDAVIVDENDPTKVLHTFKVDDEHVRDMAAEEIFTVGSHGDKMDVLMSTGKGEINYDYRRTIQQAAIKSGIANIAPAIADITLDEIIKGNFNGKESWQYHSLREVLEGRIKTGSLSTANVASLKMLFADVNSDPLASTQFNQLIADKVAQAVRDDPSVDQAALAQQYRDDFETERARMKQMAADVLRTPTVRQNTNAQSAEELEKFAGNLYTPPSNNP
jgi:hypothetical protein